MSDAVTAVGWPEAPYKGLSFYTPEDVALFAGRQQQVEYCTRILVQGDTRVLLLQGRTGCGKSSFLRAGLIPYLESRVPVFKFMPDFDITKTGALFVRCTDQPLLRLAERLYDWGERPFTTAEGEAIDMRGIRGDANDRGCFIRENGGSVDQLMKTLERIHDQFPSWLVLVIDQAEEILTQTKGRPRLRDLFFEFITAFNDSDLNLKLVVAFRSEFYGVFDDRLRRFYAETAYRRDKDPAPLQHLFLDDLSTAELVAAVKTPTSRSIDTTYLQQRCQPGEWYNFELEDGLPERIVRDLNAIKKDGSILPLLQIACNRLYKVAKKRSGSLNGHFIITEADYRQIGDMKQQVDLYLDETFSHKIKEHLLTLDDAARTEELALWRDLLCCLVIEGDAAPVTDAFAEDHLRKLTQELGCQVEFGMMASYLAHEDQRILREDRRSQLDKDGSESTARFYSLGHEVLGPALRDWQAKREVVLSRRGFVRNLLQRATPLIVWTFFFVAALIALVGLAANGEVGFWGLVTISVLVLLAGALSFGRARIAASLAHTLIDSNMFKELFVHTDDTSHVIRRMQESMSSAGSRGLSSSAGLSSQSPSTSTQDRALLKGADELLQAKPEKEYTVDDWIGRAFAAYAEEKLELGAEYFNRASRAPGATVAQQAELTFFRGVIFTELRRGDEALALYDDLIARHFNSADLTLRLPAIKAVVNKAILLADSQRLAAALACCDDLVARFGEASESVLREQVARALVIKGIFLDQTQRSDEALVTYDRLISDFMDAPEPSIRELVAIAFRNKGVHLGEMQRAEDALSVLDHMIRSFRHDPEPGVRQVVATGFVNKAFYLGAFQRYEEALGVYDEMVALFKDAAEPRVREEVARAFVSKGITLGELGRNEEAIAVYDEVLARFNGSPEPGLREQVARAFVNKGTVLSELGRNEEAIAISDEVLARFNDSPEPGLREQIAKALLNKGNGLDELQRADDSVAMYDELISRFKDAPELGLRDSVARALYNKGIALRRLQRNEDAIGVYDELIAHFKDAGEAELRVWVASALLNKGIALGQLQRAHQEISTYDELIARFGDEAAPAIRERVATALLYKGITLGQLERGDEAVAVYDTLIARYRDATEPTLRPLLERAAGLREAMVTAAS